MTSLYTGTDDEAASNAFEHDATTLLERAPEILRRFSADGTHADLFLEHSTSRTVSRTLRIGQPPGHDVASRTTSGVALNVVRGSDSFFEWMADLSRLDASTAAAASMIAAEGDRPDVTCDETSPGGSPLSDAGAEQLLASISDSLIGVQDFDRCRLTFHAVAPRRLVVAADGRAWIDRRPLARLLVDARLTTSNGPAALRLVQPIISEDADLLAAAVTQRIDERANHLRRARRHAPQVPTIVLAGGWTGSWIHEVIGHALEADVFTNGPLSGQMGQKITHPDVTLSDGPGDGDLDDEGTATRQTSLITAGTLTGLLTDQRTAHRLGLPATGNGFRADVRHAPLPRMTTLDLHAGTGRLDELTADIRRGILVNAFRAGQLRPDGTAELLNAAGWLVENGRCTEPLNGMRLRSHVRDWLNGVVAVGEDVSEECIRGVCLKQGQARRITVSAPPVRIDGIDVIAT